MQKIYPIRIEKTWKNNYKLVEWKLGNTCNYDCSFCGDSNKNGSEKWLDISLYKSVCLRLIQEADKDNKKVIFQFTGGEPTLYPDFLELLQYIKCNGGYNNIISNGSRTLRWWKELAELDVLTTLFVTVHAEQNANIDHIIEIINLFEKKATFVLAQCTAVPKYFDTALSFYNTLIDKACCKVSMKLINSSTTLDYTNEQLNKIKDDIVVPSKLYHRKTLPDITYAGKMKVTFSDNSTKVNYAHALIAEGINKFEGYNCSIGIDSLNIRYDTVYRGICREGGRIGSINEPISFMTETVTCTKYACTCGTDYHEFKILNK